MQLGEGREGERDGIIEVYATLGLSMAMAKWEEIRKADRYSERSPPKRGLGCQEGGGGGEENTGE